MPDADYTIPADCAYEVTDAMLLQQLQSAEEQGQITDAMLIHELRLAVQAQPTQGDMRGALFMCKDAISRGDSGGTFIFC